MLSARRFLIGLWFLSACSTAPANDSPCEFTNAAWCDADGRLVKVCYRQPFAPMEQDLRWHDAPAPRFKEETCGCEPDPHYGTPSAVCTTVVVDKGKVCVTPTAAQHSGGTIAADEPFYIHVHRPGCLSGSCSRDLVSLCAVVRDGNMLHLTSYFSAGQTVGGPCTADCHIPTADCISTPLPAGDYTLELGGVTTPLPIPTTVAEYACPYW